MKSSGFSVGGVRKTVVLAFVFSLLRHHLHKGPKFWLKVWLDSRLEYEALEAQIDFLAFLVLK